MTTSSIPTSPFSPASVGFRRLTACLLLTAAVTGVARADVVRRHTLPVSGIGELSIVADSGDINLRPGTSDQLEVEVEIRKQTGNRASRNLDLSKVDIGIERSAGGLELSLRDKRVQGDWIVRLPRSSQIGVSVALGVGDIDIAPPSGAMEIALGVGDVEVKARKAQVGGVSVNVGVGNASISGGEEVRFRRFVGATGSARGAGVSTFDVSVGVGDVDIRLD
ncbi:MAG: hypothetical protein KGS00_09565 [Alphaproteobacteria bacterium]|nr:hypothetical protein [Alphaproteobacteria bacterium]